MGIFSRKKKTKTAPAPKSFVDLECTYRSMDGFRGTKRLHVTTYGDIENGEENALHLLGNDDRHDCTGSSITLTSFRFDGGSGIKVAVDGLHLGVVWEHSADGGVYMATYAGSIDGVFVRIEDGGRTSLFVRLSA